MKDIIAILVSLCLIVLLSRTVSYTPNNVSDTAMQFFAGAGVWYWMNMIFTGIMGD